MRGSALLGLAFAAVVLPTAAARQDSGEDFFERKIRPLLADRCYSCHSSRAEKVKGSLRVDSRDALLKGGDRGPSVVPGDPAKSLLLQAVRHADDDLKMPPKGKLSDAQIADLETWIKRGAPWSSSPSSAIAKAGSHPERHWAFEPPKEVEPPRVKRAGWARNPIDAFVLARLEDAGLAPSAPADKRTLLRRATLDVIGLPPTPAEIDAYLADDSPDAFEKVVDRLLGSPHYGERWGRHWLDVARYADTTDYDANGAVAGDVRLVHSALYRDWVIRALNEDLPYDRFLVAQIAGDQVGAPEAMGFLTIGRRFGGNVHDTIDERLDVLGRGTLGLTLSCARCHDHKFDPIPTRDYYSLYGVFQASKEKTITLAGPSRDDYESELRRRNEALAAYKRAKGEEVKRHLRSNLAEYVAALGGADEAAEARGLHALLLRALRDFVTKNHIDVHAAKDGEELLRSLSAFPPLVKPPEQLEEYFDIAASYEISYWKSKIARWDHAAPGAPRWAVILEDGPAKENPRIFRRGNPASPGDAVPRQFLEVLCGAAREPFKSGSGRLELARAIASAGNPTTARVIVNRLWLGHFGRGLVPTPSDFGLRSDPPSHPELLDWLARRLIAESWSLKAIHRLILASATYRQSGGDNPAARTADPENRLLWRVAPRRLDFEALRDSILAVSGTLDASIAGAAEVLTSQPYCRRRSVYGFIDRLNVSNLLLAFDVPNPAAHSSRRHETVVPQQALFLMNSPFLLEHARHLAACDDVNSATPRAARIQALYRRVFGRPATPREIEMGLRFVQGAPPPSEIPPSAWTYGSGGVEESGRVTFHPLPCFTGQSWQCSPYLPDPDLGWISLDATGGTPGDDLRHAAIRRWTSPCDGTVSIRGSVKLLYDADVYQGRIRVRAVSSRSGEVARRDIGRGEVEIAADGLEVKRGDTIDFVAECPERVAYSRFSWAPAIAMNGDKGRGWSAETEFAGPPEAPLSAWEAYAQALLMSNEFFFVD